MIAALDDARQSSKFRNRQLFGPSFRRDSRFSQQKLRHGGQLLEARAQHLSTLTESCRRNASERRDPALRLRHRNRSKFDDGGRNFRRRRERFGRQRHDDLGARPPLRKNREAAIGLRARRGNDAICNLALKHQHHAVEPRRPWLRLEPADKQQGGDAVRQVGGNRHRLRTGDKRRPISLERIARMHRQTTRIMRRDLFERRQAPGIAFDRDDTLCAFHQQRSRQATGTRSDLDDRAMIEVT